MNFNDIVTKLEEVLNEEIIIGEPKYTGQANLDNIAKIDVLEIDAFSKAYVQLAYILLNQNMDIK